MDVFDRALKQEFLDGLKRRQPPPYQLIAVAEPTLWRELLVRLGLRQRRTKIVPTTKTFTWKEIARALMAEIDAALAERGGEDAPDARTP